MAKTLGDLRSYTRMLLDEVIAADWSNAQVDASINYAYQGMVSAAVTTFEDYYTKASPTLIDTVADQQEYGEDEGFPTDFFKLRRVEINFNTSDSNATAKRALPVTLDDIDRNLANTNLGLSPQRNPGYYLIGQGSNLKIGFIPVPDETGTDAIKIWYVYTPSDLSESTDAIDVPYPDRYGRYIAYGAAGDLLRKGQQEEPAAAVYVAEYEIGLKKMQSELEDRRADDIRGVTDTSGTDLFFDRYHNV